MVQLGPFDIELVPKTSWHKALKDTLPKRKWEKIRRRELERAGYKCEICGYSGKGLICHEIWHYDDSARIQRLVGYKIVCGDCSLIYHLGRTVSIGLEGQAIQHLSHITGVSVEEAEKQLRQVSASYLLPKWKERSQYSWTIDSSYEKEI